jgi:two-component system sensor histidine kinase AtoS
VSPASYALLGLTAIVGGLAAVLVYATLRFAAAARDARRHSRESGADVAILSAALHDAVTKLKAQERATAERAEASERLSSEIISSITAGLLVVDLTGAVTILNPAGRRMLELPEREYVRAPREQPLWDVIDECLRTGVAVVRRSVALDKVGGGVHLGVTVSPIRDGHAQLHGAICLFTDLTAIEGLEEQLRLKESLATVGELTAGIAHEFRNGLATILGYSKLFDLNLLPGAYQEYVRGIRNETESLSQVVTNFLNFARPAQLTLTRVDVGALCERAAEEIRGDVEASGGSVSVRGTFGDVEGDEVLLRQAFSNLLRNAVEACTGAGVVPDVVILAELDRGQSVSRISVNDNGPGIPAPARERVFRPFFTSKRSGTGLGLALVQKIVVSHNGRIVVGDAPGGGASLQVTLPLAP